MEEKINKLIKLYTVLKWFSFVGILGSIITIGILTFTFTVTHSYFILVMLAFFAWVGWKNNEGFYLYRSHLQQLKKTKK